MSADVLIVQFHRDASAYLATNDRLNRKTVVLSSHGSAKSARGFRARNVFVAPDAKRGKGFGAILTAVTGREWSGTVTVLDPAFVEDEA